MEYVQSFALDMNGSGDPPCVVRVKQHDNETRAFSVSLLQDEVPYAIDGSADFTLRCGKPNGTVSEIAGTKTGANTLRFVLTEDATDTDGVCLCDVCFKDGDEVLSSASFYMVVSHSPNGRGN